MWQIAVLVIALCAALGYVYAARVGYASFSDGDKVCRFDDLIVTLRPDEIVAKTTGHSALLAEAYSARPERPFFKVGVTVELEDEQHKVKRIYITHLDEWTNGDTQHYKRWFWITRPQYAHYKFKRLISVYRHNNEFYNEDSLLEVSSLGLLLGQMEDLIFGTTNLGRTKSVHVDSKAWQENPYSLERWIFYSDGMCVLDDHGNRRVVEQNVRWLPRHPAH